MAQELEIAETTMSKWLKGRFDSARIADAANRKALEFIEQERSNAK